MSPRMKRKRAQRCAPTSDDLIEVALMPGREVVESDHVLVEFEQRFQQVRSDEARDTGHQPGLRCGPQCGPERVVCHQSRHKA